MPCPVKLSVHSSRSETQGAERVHCCYKQLGSSLEQPVISHFFSHLSLAVRPPVITHCVENSLAQYFSTTYPNVSYCSCWKNDSTFSLIIFHGDWGLMSNIQRIVIYVSLNVCVVFSVSADVWFCVHCYAHPCSVLFWGLCKFTPYWTSSTSVQYVPYWLVIWRLWNS